jgi:histone arginine demethylase JMJD6
LYGPGQTIISTEVWQEKQPICRYFESVIRLAKKSARSELSISQGDWSRHGFTDSDVLDTSPLFTPVNQPYLVPRVHASQLTVEDFIERFEVPKKPVIIQGLLGEWAAASSWTPQKLLQKFPEARLKVGSDDDGYPVRMKLKHYLMYISDPRHSRDDSPLYIFDSTFADKRCAPSLQQVRATAHDAPCSS